MSEIRIEIDERITDPQILAILKAHETHCTSMTPPESCHRLEIDALRAREIAFVVAKRDDEVLGVGALADIGQAWGEVKSMHVRHDLRGEGIGALILDHILQLAHARQMTMIGLETGNTPNFHAAVRQYQRAGFAFASPFGKYKADPNSIFMTKSLT